VFRYQKPSKKYQNYSLFDPFYLKLPLCFALKHVVIATFLLSYVFKFILDLLIKDTEILTKDTEILTKDTEMLIKDTEILTIYIKVPKSCSGNRSERTFWYK
jgi:hypothetical protein